MTRRKQPNFRRLEITAPGFFKQCLYVSRTPYVIKESLITATRRYLYAPNPFTKWLMEPRLIRAQERKLLHDLNGDIL